MPDEIAKNFERIVEMDMKRLEAEVAERKKIPETTIQSRGDRQIIKEALVFMANSANDDDSDDNSNKKDEVFSSGRSRTVIDDPLPAYVSGASPETKLEIEYLLELAFHRGIKKANSEAKKSSPFVMDAFHDALAGKLYDELKKRGIVE